MIISSKETRQQLIYKMRFNYHFLGLVNITDLKVGVVISSLSIHLFFFLYLDILFFFFFGIMIMNNLAFSINCSLFQKFDEYLMANK